MAAENSLKFIKQSNGNVLLLKTDNNEFIASFIPSLTIERDKDNANRFEVMSQYIDYRSIDCDACSPVIVAANFDEFLIELSEKFFFEESGSKGSTGLVPNRFIPNSGYTPNYDGYTLFDYVTANGDRQKFVSLLDTNGVPTNILGMIDTDGVYTALFQLLLFPDGIQIVPAY